MRKSRPKLALLKASRLDMPVSFFSIIPGLVGLGNC